MAIFKNNIVFLFTCDAGVDWIEFFVQVDFSCICCVESFELWRFKVSVMVILMVLLLFGS